MLYYWLGLYYTPHIGSKRLAQLLRQLGCVQQVFEASDAAWQQAGIPLNVISGRHHTAIKHKIEAALNWLKENPLHHIICLSDEDYPFLLKAIADPPLLFFVKGPLSLLQKPQLAIVGSRHPTPEGLENAYAFSHQLGIYGFVITSGLALGIDGAAHRGAVDHDLPTIAVLGTGLARIYPKQHQGLAAAIVEQGGCLLSEFPLHTPPLAENFPKRNRIIAGLALGVLVVEAASRSGSLITARLALEYNREVFAIPSSIHHAQSKGCHQLIRDGAILVESIEDIYVELKNWLPGTHTQSIRAFGREPSIIQGADVTEAATDPAGGPVVKMVFELLVEPLTIDELVVKTALDASELMNHLLTMEIEGFILRLPGGRFKKA